MADVRAGHAPFLLCLGAGNLVRPVTVVRNKTTIDSEHLELLTWGAAQLGIGQGVCDAVERGLIPLEHVDDLVLLVAVYVDPQAGDHTAVREANRRQPTTRSRMRCRPITASLPASWWQRERARATASTAGSSVSLRRRPGCGPAREAGASGPARTTAASCGRSVPVRRFEHGARAAGRS